MLVGEVGEVAEAGCEELPPACVVEEEPVACWYEGGASEGMSGSFDDIVGVGFVEGLSELEAMTK